MNCSCSQSDHVQRSRRLGDGSGAPYATLSADELQRVAEILRAEGALGDEHRIAYIGLDEPDRTEVAAGRSVPRRARVQLLDVDSGRARALSVDLDSGALAKDIDIDPEIDGQVPLLQEEHAIIRELIGADQRGRPDLTRVLITCTKGSIRLTGRVPQAQDRARIEADIRRALHTAQLPYRRLVNQLYVR